MDARTSRYHEVYARWQRDPEGFWGEAAHDIDWYEKPKAVFDPNAGVYGRWFPGRLQHLLQRRRPPRRARARRPGRDHLRLAGHRHQARHHLCRAARRGAPARRGPADFGVAKGDRVILYMPMVPEAVVAMLACARIGAIHSVVFGGFAAEGAGDPHRRRQAQGDPLRELRHRAGPRGPLQAAARRGDRARRAQAATPA